MRIGAIIQARMGSTRLEGKVMKELEGKSVLSHVIERVEQSRLIDEIIIATTIHDRDSVIASEANRCGVKVFRGSEDDVLSRYYFAAKENNIDIILRITSDCPVIDPNIIDEMVDIYLKSNYDLVSNAGIDAGKRTFPRGLDISIFSLELLEEAFNNSTRKYEREHVTPYMYENSSVFYYKNDKNYSNHRWTLDTPEDYELIKEIYNHLYKGKHDFYMRDILDLLKGNPELFKINQHIEQKKIK
ncbi:MAG: cytidylyltransferase domain-containing protein [Tissierella sp.]|uniref:cytidylyltransferase domain-containing protein n=1 Tax=Tissierella sp. TaxID=41274 RepID=UPI003F9D6059